MNDSFSKSHLIKEIQEKQRWRSSRLREYIFSHCKSNTFLQELSPHSDLLRDFSIQEMDLLLKTEDLGEQDAYPSDSIRNETEAKRELKAKITNIMSQSHSIGNDFFYLGYSKKAMKGNMPPQQTLYDYFMESKRKRFMNGDLGKIKAIIAKKQSVMKAASKELGSLTSRTQKETKESLYIPETGERNSNSISQVVLPVLGRSPLKRIKENMHLFLDLPPKLNRTTPKGLEKKLGFISDRRDYREKKPKTIDFGIDLVKNKTGISEFKEEGDEILFQGLPLKYRSREIYQKLLEKNKKTRVMQSVSSGLKPLAGN